MLARHLTICLRNSSPSSAALLAKSVTPAVSQNVLENLGATRAGPALLRLLPLPPRFDQCRRACTQPVATLISEYTDSAKIGAELGLN
jgi:hypothetical protein